MKNPHVVFRRVQADEIQATADLHEDVLGYEAERFIRYAQEEGSEVFVAVKHPRRIVGYLLCRVRTKRDGTKAEDLRIVYTGVHKSHRRQGICSGLLDCAKQRLSEQNLRSIVLEVDYSHPEAGDCYEANGFVWGTGGDDQMFFPTQPAGYYSW